MYQLSRQEILTRNYFFKILLLVTHAFIHKKDCFSYTVNYLSDAGNLNKAGNIIFPCPGGVVDILEACGAFDPGSSPGRGVLFFIK